MGKELNLYTFGEMMDEFLEKNHIQMLVDMPEGTIEVTIKDNTNLGPVVHFYILIRGLITTFREFSKMIDKEGFIDDLMAEVKKELLEEEE